MIEKDLLPMLCVQCSMPVEDDRRCYAHPTCHACLPPAPQLPIVEGSEEW